MDEQYTLDPITVYSGRTTLGNILLEAQNETARISLSMSETEVAMLIDRLTQVLSSSI